MKAILHVALCCISLFLVSCRPVPADHLLIRADLTNLLPSGSSDALVFGEVVYNNPRLVELQKKMTDAIKKNADWFAEYKKKYSLPMPYHENLGLTFHEYEDLLVLSDTSRPVLKMTGSESLEVIHGMNTIRFRSRGMLEFFNRVKVDFRDNTVSMNGNILKFLSKESDTDTANIFRSAWYGYSWQYLEPANLSQVPINDYSQGNVRNYRFTVGRLARGGRTFIIVKGLQYDNGQKVFDFEAPIIL